MFPSNQISYRCDNEGCMTHQRRLGMNWLHSAWFTAVLWIIWMDEVGNSKFSRFETLDLEKYIFYVMEAWIDCYKQFLNHTLYISKNLLYLLYEIEPRIMLWVVARTHSSLAFKAVWEALQDKWSITTIQITFRIVIL